MNSFISLMKLPSKHSDKRINFTKGKESISLKFKESYLNWSKQIVLAITLFVMAIALMLIFGLFHVIWAEITLNNGAHSVAIGSSGSLIAINPEGNFDGSQYAWGALIVIGFFICSVMILSGIYLLSIGVTNKKGFDRLRSNFYLIESQGFVANNKADKYSLANWFGYTGLISKDIKNYDSSSSWKKTKKTEEYNMLTFSKGNKTKTIVYNEDLNKSFNFTSLGLSLIILAVLLIPLFIAVTIIQQQIAVNNGDSIYGNSDEVVAGIGGSNGINIGDGIFWNFNPQGVYNWNEMFNIVMTISIIYISLMVISGIVLFYYGVKMNSERSQNILEIEKVINLGFSPSDDISKYIVATKINLSSMEVE